MRERSPIIILSLTAAGAVYYEGPSFKHNRASNESDAGIII